MLIRETEFKLIRALLLGMLLGLCSVATAQQSRGITIEPVKKQALTPFNQGVYRALIIGNNYYHDSKGQWPPLKTAVSGARAVQQVLKDSYGFSDVELLENASRQRLAA